MKDLEMDSRSREDIINEIRRIAPSYTPEWRFDQENPDVGTALAVLFADMLADTIRKFNRVPEKNRISFFDHIGAKLLPAVPASGYVTFGLVNDMVEGVPVKKGTQVSAQTEEAAEGSLVFETMQELYVTNSHLDDIYLTDGKRDYIHHLFHRKSFWENPVPFHFFDLERENQQGHSFYIGQNEVLQWRYGAVASIDLIPFGKNTDVEEIYHNFLNPDKIEIAYYSEKGFCQFESRALEGDSLILIKGEEQPPAARLTIPVEEEEIEGNFIRFTIKDIHAFDSLTLKKIMIRSAGEHILPELIHAAGADQRIHEFLPFGERLMELEQVYIASNEALGKRGAWIQLTFDLDFIRIPMESMEYGEEREWKLIMKRQEFKPDLEYDITIDSVLWEYYNGVGWCRLFPNNQYAHVFSTKDGTIGQRVQMAFKCPEDIETFVVNSLSSFFIRARILKVNNAFKLKGNYIVPLISRMYFRYEYLNDGVVPNDLILYNNMASQVRKGTVLSGKNTLLKPFQGLEQDVPAMYWGFSEALREGPVKILFSLFDTIPEQLPLLTFEYYGSGRWKALNMVDETENFRVTGILTLIGEPDFEACTLFGNECFWIRVTDTRAYYEEQKKAILPCITGIYMNSAKIAAIETQTREEFFIEANEENLQCHLQKGQIYDAQVWVDEYRIMDMRKLEDLKKNYKVKQECSEDGQIEKLWVLWTQTDSFAASGPEDRHYMLDKNDGVVSFSNGKNGAIPPSGLHETILVKYRCGGGTIGNLEAGRITGLNQTIGFINQVDNKEITTGGCNQETVEACVERSRKAFKRGMRGVTRKDFEFLALEASRNLLRAKCFPNVNEKGEREPGSVTLAVLQKDYIRGGKYFPGIKNQVLCYMKERISGNLAALNHFYVTEPQFLNLSFSIFASAADYNMVFEVRKQIEEKIVHFLDPISGNFSGKGWEIGILPNTTQIRNALKASEGEYVIHDVRMSACRRGTIGMEEIDLDGQERSPFALALSGEHKIFVTYQ